MKYLSICSGIEAASVAFEPLGWSPVAFSEIDAFPSAVLAHHWPHVPNLGDMTQFASWPEEVFVEADVIIGGTPCFTAGHMVLCADGYKPIEDVEVGDLVVTHEGRLKPVARVGSEVKPVGKLMPIGNPIGVTCTADHPFLSRTWHTQNTKRNNKYARIVTIGEPEWVAAEQMVNRQWVALTAYDRTEEMASPSPRFTNQEASLLAGMYLGDGWVRRWTGKNKKALVLGLNPEKYARFLQEFPGASHNVSHERTTVRVTICDTALCDWLLQEFGSGSGHKKIPAWTLWDINRRHILQGYLATDGSRHKVGDGFTINSISRTLSYGMRDLAQSLGYVGSIGYVDSGSTAVIEGRTVNQQPYYQLRIFAAATSRQSRTHQNHLLRKVRSWSPSGEEAVYNIEVEDDHSYILDGMVVHNCQAWSVAGLRGGLSDARGNLTLVFVQLVNHADAIRRQHGKPPVIIVWENVPGVLSSKDNGFGCFLGGLAGEDEALVPAGKRWTNAGGVLGPQRTIAWRILDAQYFGLAQRRQRVFVVASAGTVSPPEILFESGGLRRDSAPGRSAGQDTSATATRRPAGGSHWDHFANPHPTLNQSHNTGGLGGSNQEIFSQRGSGLVPMAFNHQAGGSLFPIAPSHELANTLQAHQGQAVLDVFVAFALRGREDGSTVGALRAASGGSSRDYVAYGGYRDTTPKFAEELMPTLRVGGDGGDNHFVAFGGNNTSGPIDVATARNACPSPSGRMDFETETFLETPETLGVRRITPVESERLQGFPDNHTRISWRGKSPENCPDGHRQKAIGNSMAVPVIRWLGRKIQSAVQ